MLHKATMERHDIAAIGREFHTQPLKWLMLACEERNVYSLMIASDPSYDPLRADRRFVKLLRRMKLDG